MKRDTGGYPQLLADAGFHCFLWTQFLGAFNDSLCQIVISLRAVHVAARSGAGTEYLALANAVFVIPFLLFSGWSGRLADMISKRTVLVSVKVFEMLVMAFGIAVFFTTRIELMMVVLFLMGLHSTVFSPAKYGIVPEIVGDRQLSRANGLLEMSTFVAIVLGTSIGTMMFAGWKGEIWKAGVVMLAVSVIGFTTSLRIPHAAAAGAGGAWHGNPFSEVATGTRELLRDRPLALTVAAISYFWFLGALLKMDLLLFGQEVLRVSDLRVGLLWTCLALGIGAGSMLAGRWSGNKVELGLVPLGALWMGLFSIGVYGAQSSYHGSVMLVALLGLATGLFIVPLNAFLQQRAGAAHKGRAIATNNFYNTLGLALASGTLWLLHGRLQLGADKLILIFGFVTLAVAAVVMRVVPDFLVRFVLWMAAHTLYRIRIVGAENVPARGGALLVANHTSLIDGLFIGASIQRFIRFLVWKPYYEKKSLQWLFRLAKAIPVASGPARETAASIRQARAELAGGHLVCIFAEGAVTRTGNLLPFKRGLERIAERMDVPVIPVHLDRVWGSVFSFAGGRFLWKWPARLPYPVTVTFGTPLPPTSAAHEVRQAIQELGAEAANLRKSAGDLLPLRFVQAARRNWRRFAMADSSGRELTYGRALAASVLLAEWIRKRSAEEERIGLMLPASVAGALANLATSMAGRIPVNLNFTAGGESVRAAVAQCRIHTVLTSRAFLTKAQLEPMEEMVFLEDIFAAQRGAARLRAWLAARLLPARLLTGSRRSPDSTATIIFSSGSTGVPKGVELSHYNIVSNIEAMAQVFAIRGEDRIIGSLPLFHSFGYTVTVWLPLITGCGAAYHPNPLDARSIGALVARYRGTFLLATPTFCLGYVRKCAREEMASLRYVLVGAEKLREPAAAAFHEAFGLELREGYGVTEMSPVVAVNAPDYEAGRDTQIGTKAGTVGQPLPGVAVKIVDPVTQAPLGPNQEGLLLVKGPNRMIGYLDRPDLTREALVDGWYNTGDIAALDDDGFLRITDRLTRFSKIGGEMVPHLKVEDAVAEILGGDYRCVVTGIPDDHRGERLVAMHTRPDITPAELWQRLAAGGMPRLWLPRREDIHLVDAIPLLGSGKVDLGAARSMAKELAGREREVLQRAN